MCSEEGGGQWPRCEPITQSPSERVDKLKLEYNVTVTGADTGQQTGLKPCQ